MPTTINFIESTSGGSAISADVDGIPLIFSGGVASQSLDSGAPHKLHWYVAGPPGSTYEIGITDPATVVFKRIHTLDSSGIDYGIHYFTP